MTSKKTTFEISVEDIDTALIAKGIQTPEQKRFDFSDKTGTPERDDVMSQVKAFYAAKQPPSLNPALMNFSTDVLIKKFLDLTTGEITRGISGKDTRMDLFTIKNKMLKQNFLANAAIFMAEDLIDNGKGFSSLRVKNFGTTFNLSILEPFRDQPICAGQVCTGVLVAEDIIATAGHCADDENVEDLRIVFGYKMLDESIPVTKFPAADIYRGIKILGRDYNPQRNGSDWALVKLDRKVAGRVIAKLSERPLAVNQQVYIMGHPCGLPLKYSAGASIGFVSDSFFSADLNVYCGNSGSPVFDSRSHELIGIVARGDNQDFRWTGKDWISIIYPHPQFHSKEPQCTRISEFIQYIRECQVAGTDSATKILNRE